MKRQQIEEKLEQRKGLFPLNLAIAEEREYYLESIGGEKALKANFPVLYEAFQKSCMAAEKRMADGLGNEVEKGEPDVHFDTYDIMTTDAAVTASDGIEDVPEYAYLTANLSGDFLDKTVLLSDREAAQAFNVSINGKIYDPNSARLPYMEIHESYTQVNHIDDCVQGDDACHKKEFWDRMLKLKLTVSVFDAENMLYPYAYSKTTKYGKPVDYAIANIHIDAPVSKHSETQEIRILYARTAQNLENPDYIYKSNNADEHNGKLWTIVPIKGSVTLKSITSGDSYFSFDKLTEPEEGETWGRSTLQYDGKDWKTYQETKDDKALYELLTQNNFTVETGSNHVETLQFDLFNPDYKDDKNSDRYYDWNADIDKASTDNRERICYLIGGFAYDICKKDKEGKVIVAGTEYQIQFRSKDPKDLGDRTYYTYKMGSNTIYIPPIHLWWGCYADETLILLADGQEMRADQIRIGDVVSGMQDNNLTVNNIFTGQEERLIQIQTEEGLQIGVSVGHPMCLEDGSGIAAERLHPGDRIMRADGRSTEVIGVQSIPYGKTVYNFTFEGKENGTYLKANGLLSGDFYAQNRLKEYKAPPTMEQQKLIEELNQLARQLKN